jgi:hypothetical protein
MSITILHKNDVRFVLFTLFVYGGVQHILCCVFVLILFPSRVTCVASFSGLSIFDYPWVCSSIYKDNMSVEWHVYLLPVFSVN